MQKAQQEILKKQFGDRVMILDDKNGESLEDEVKKKAKESMGIADEDEEQNLIMLQENCEFFQDFYNLYWNRFYTGSNRFLYAVFMVLQVKEGVVPTLDGTISKELIDEEYDMVGYGIEQFSHDDGKIKFGTYEVDLYKPPVYVCEIEQIRKLPCKLKVTIDFPGNQIKPSRPVKQKNNFSKLPPYRLAKYRKRDKQT